MTEQPGLIQQGTPELKDPLLIKLQKGIEAKLDPTYRTAYLSILNAGMAVLYSDQTHQFLTSALNAAVQRGDLNKAIVQGTIKLIGLIIQQTKERWTAQHTAAAFSAAPVLMYQIMEFVESAKQFQADPNTVAVMTHALTVALLGLFKIDQQKFAQGVDYLHQQQGATPGPTGTPAVGQVAPAPPATAPITTGG